MNRQKQKFSELKKQAREAMAGRCGTLVGATAINLFLTFSCSLIPTLIFSGTTLYDIIFLNLTLFLFSLLLSLFQAGYLKICAGSKGIRIISHRFRCRIQDIFPFLIEGSHCDLHIGHYPQKADGTGTGCENLKP